MHFPLIWQLKKIRSFMLTIKATLFPWHNSTVVNFELFSYLFFPWISIWILCIRLRNMNWIVDIVWLFEIFWKNTLFPLNIIYCLHKWKEYSSSFNHLKLKSKLCKFCHFLANWKSKWSPKQTPKTMTNETKMKDGKNETNIKRSKNGKI